MARGGSSKVVDKRPSHNKGAPSDSDSGSDTGSERKRPPPRPSRQSGRRAPRLSTESGSDDPVLARARALEEANNKLAKPSDLLSKDPCKNFPKWKTFVLCVLIAGIIMICDSVGKVNSRRGSVAATCKIMSHQYDDDFVFMPGIDHPCPKQNLGFVIRGSTESREVFFVQDWEPPFDKTSPPPARGWQDDKAFECCQLEPFDHCKFSKNGRFCDDFGGDCPSTPWDCHVMNFDSFKNGEGLERGDLRVGGASEGQITLAVGCIMVSVALIRLLLPRTMAFVYHVIVKRAGLWVVRFITYEFPLFVAQVLHPKIQPRMIQDVVYMDWGVRVLQRWWKRVYFMKALERALQASRERKARAEAYLREQEFALVAANKLRYAAVPPPLGTPAPLPGCLLYDTGNVNTFRRMVQARVASETGGLCGTSIEMALATPSVKLGADIECRPGSFPLPPYVTRVLRCGVADLYGLQRGDELVKVGSLLWPHVGARQLLEAYRRAPRPLFLVFRGEQRRLETIERNCVTLAPGVLPAREAEGERRRRGQAAANRRRGERLAAGQADREASREASREAAAAAEAAVWPPGAPAGWPGPEDVLEPQTPEVPDAEPAVLEPELGVPEESDWGAAPEWGTPAGRFVTPRGGSPWPGLPEDQGTPARGPGKCFAR